jgi:hypothetical protein
MLDGELLKREPVNPTNQPLAEFIASLPGMAHAAGTALADQAEERAAMLGEEVRRVEWRLPDGFDVHEFHPLGHDGTPSWPITDLDRLLVISPFVSTDGLARLRRDVRGELSLVGRFEELLRLEPSDLQMDVFDDPGALLDVDDDLAADGGGDREEADPVELAGLHAKIYVGERGRRAVIFVGSPNATAAAFDRNVEFLVQLRGSRAQHGIQAVRAALDEAGLLTPFKHEGLPAIDEAGEALERKLERAAHELATGGLRARVEAVSDGQWRTVLVRAKELTLDDVRVEGRPLPHSTLRAIELGRSPCAVFPPTALSSISAFFALRLTAVSQGRERRLDVTVRLPLDDAPAGRAEAVTAELLSDRERLLRFILLLLSEDRDTDRILGELEELSAERQAGGSVSSTNRALGLPLLEPLLRALHRNPKQLDEIDRLLRDIRTAGGSTEALLPEDLEALWMTISELRKERA